jgi:arylsulfatase A-like enzyme
VALSATDYIGHSFGPDSLEWEDNLLRLDSQVARLLDWADREIGLDRTLVAMTSDHGIPSAPELLDREGASSGRVDVPGMLRGLREELIREFGLRSDPVLGAKMPSIFLDWRALAAADHNRETVEQAAARYLERIDGVAAAVTRSDLLSGRVPSSEPMRRILAGFHEDLSGDLVIVQQPGWYLENDPEKYATNHGSPYEYDAHVPMMFLAPGLQPRVVDRVVSTEDFAPSIAGFLEVERPAQASGAPLEEIAPATGAGSYNPVH